MLKDILLCAAGLTAIFIIPAIIVALMWRRAIRRGTRTHEAWLHIADDLGLVYEPKKNILGMEVAGSLCGKFRDRDLLLASIRETSLPIPFIVRAREKWFFRIRISLRPHQQLKLSFSRKDLLWDIQPFKWAHEISTGDHSFDEVFTVRSDSEVVARRVFASAFLRQKLVQGPAPPFGVLPDRIESEIPAEDYGIPYWRSVLDVLCDIADAIENL